MADRYYKAGELQLTIIQEMKRGMNTIPELILACNTSVATIRSTLSRLAANGFIKRINRGEYAIV